MLVLASILAIFVYGMTAATLGTILPDLSERFGLTPSQNGQIAFAQASGLMIASLLVGPLLDNGGTKAACCRARTLSSPRRSACKIAIHRVQILVHSNHPQRRKKLGSKESIHAFCGSSRGHRKRCHRQSNRDD